MEMTPREHPPSQGTKARTTEVRFSNKATLKSNPQRTNDLATARKRTLPSKTRP
jgi:hypothetical protein